MRSPRCIIDTRNHCVRRGGTNTTPLSASNLQYPLSPTSKHRLQLPRAHTPLTDPPTIDNFLAQPITMFSRSSSSSTLSDSAKRHLLSCLPTDAKVLATASAKIYHAPFSSKTDGWTYSGLSGTLVFGRDRTAVQADRNLGESLEQSFWFRLVDPTKGLVWVHQIPPTLDYALDKPFFHTFSGKVRHSRWVLARPELIRGCLLYLEPHVWLPLRRRRRGDQVHGEAHVPCPCPRRARVPPRPLRPVPY